MKLSLVIVKQVTRTQSVKVFLNLLKKKISQRRQQKITKKSQRLLQRRQQKTSWRRRHPRRLPRRLQIFLKKRKRRI